MKLDWPTFWYRQKCWQICLLSPLSKLYARVAEVRLSRSAPSPDCPLIAVGNFTSGGGGKTPIVRWLRHWAKGQGFSPAVVLRGYGAKMKQVQRVRPDHLASDVGDEALLHADDGPTYCGRDRLGAIRLARKEGADLILMDDGVQGRHINPTLTLMAIDGLRGLGNGLCLPSGPLRAPLSAQAGLTSAIIITNLTNPLTLPQELADRPAFHASYTLSDDDKIWLAGRSVLAFAAIANSDKFRLSLEKAGAKIIDFICATDHHVWQNREAERMLMQAQEKSIDLVTTAKDGARLRGCEGACGRLREACRVIDVTLDFGEARERVSGYLDQGVKAFHHLPSSGKTP